MTSDECRRQARDYATRAAAANISARHATVLRSISRTWTTLAGQLDRLQAVQAAEA
jgi:hypothetical protein